MKSKKNRIFCTIAKSIIFASAILYLIWPFLIQPLIDLGDSYLSNVGGVSLAEYNEASKGNPEALARLEDLTHKDAFTAFVKLNGIYRENELKAARVNMDSPNANFDSIDLKKSNALIFRATQELSDTQLLWALGEWEVLFNDQKRDMLLGIADSSFSEPKRNLIRYSTHSTFDKETKEYLNACKHKLETESNSIWGVGACSQTPRENLLISTWKAALKAKLE